MEETICQKEWKIIVDAVYKKAKVLEHYWSSTEESITFQDDEGKIATWKHYNYHDDDTIKLIPGRDKNEDDSE